MPCSKACAADTGCDQRRFAAASTRLPTCSFPAPPCVPAPSLQATYHLQWPATNPKRLAPRFVPLTEAETGAARGQGNRRPAFAVPPLRICLLPLVWLLPWLVLVPGCCSRPCARCDVPAPVLQRLARGPAIPTSASSAQRRMGRRSRLRCRRRCRPWQLTQSRSRRLWTRGGDERRGRGGSSGASPRGCSRCFVGHCVPCIAACWPGPPGRNTAR